MAMKRTERERFAEFFHFLVHAGTDSEAGTEHDPESDAALRVLSHALLNYWGVRQGEDPERNAEISAQMTHALPWLAAFLASTREPTAPGRRVYPGDKYSGGTYPDDEARARRPLSEAMIARRLDALGARASSAFASAPRDAHAHADPQLDVFCALARTERRLAALANLDAQALRDELLGNSFLLAAAAERCEEAGADSPAPATSLLARLRAAIEPWQGSNQPAHTRSFSPAVWALAELHNAEPQGAAMAAAMGAGAIEIAPKSLRFERGLVENMARMGFISAVRAALAFVPASACQTAPHALAGADARASFLRQFSVFRADESLLQLASALMQTRGLCLDYLRGGAPLASLSPWVDYLRGGCAELAEARECTLREAMSYAHYCLHLVNICDFAALELPTGEHARAGEAPLSEATREALCQVEDELKEFALLGQREGLSDAQADLGRFERARWRREGDAPFVADRLSRLRGAWRKGVIPAPIGAPPRLDPDLSAHSLAIIDNLLVEAGESQLSGLATIASNARFRGYSWLEWLAPADILKLVALCTSAARDLPGVDVTRPFDIDLRELGKWASDPQRGRLNRRILSMLLKRREMAEILNGDAASQGGPMALRRGLVAHIRHASDARATPSHLVMQFIADPELQALLELMGTSSAEDPAFDALLERRLETMLHRHDANAARESVLDDSADSAAPQSSTHPAETYSSSQPAAN